MRRIDEFVSHEINGIRYRRGRLLPFGATVVGDNAVNFSVYSKDAYSCSLVLYNIGADEPFVEIRYDKYVQSYTKFIQFILWHSCDMPSCFIEPDFAKCYFRLVQLSAGLNSLVALGT